MKSNNINIPSILFYSSLGVIIGYISWGHGLFWTFFSLALIFAYFLISIRLYMFLFALSYYLAASRSLFFGTINYYDIYTAIGVYTAAAVATSLPWVLFFSSKIDRKIYLFLIVQLFLIMPPLGYISWVNPIQVAGLIFPATGFFGFFILYIIIVFLVFLHLSHKRWFYFILFFLVALAFNNHKNVRTIQELQTKNTNFGDSLDQYNLLEEFKRQNKNVSVTNASKKLIILLPENAVGTLKSSLKLVYQNLDFNKTVIAGAYQIKDDKYYYNTITLVTSTSITPVYYQRVPVPISMWRPYSNDGAIASLHGAGSFMVHKKRYGALICYEQLITPTYIQTMLENPDYIIGVSNLWWAKDTSILNIQIETMQLWSLLFDKPYSLSYNY